MQAEVHVHLLSTPGLFAVLFTLGCDPPPNDEELRRWRDDKGEEGDGDGETLPVRPPSTMRFESLALMPTACVDSDDGSVCDASAHCG